ncbi:hypothetical protein HYV89_04835 [Candidatus Woesearchaeota archaeon]|nr:hypothetical protein [Candidatus Woesearchaeota archaeon]
MTELIVYEKRVLSKNDFIEIKAWKFPVSEDFPNGVKYSFAYIRYGKRVFGYDNERGKGHHRHFEDKEEEIEFEGYENCLRSLEMK